MKRRIVSAIIAVVTMVASQAPTARATFAQGQPSPAGLSAILAKLAADPTTPTQYKAQVKLHVRLRVFPWISMTLNGDSVYKRPGLYHFVFKGVPKAAEHFSDLAYDLGTAATWPQKYNITLQTPGSAGVEPVVRLIPKKHGMVKYLDVSVDMAKGHIDKAVWNRFDGGVISLVQHYDTVGNNEIVADQVASIDIPHMKAELEATYSGFDVNSGVAQK